ncbi:hypothetical protein FTUN_5870 [Frigoriglobus tundricola]|uniref:Uncharacterized protein n=1 Tax=Frigoriglobus tundricola TaxID=2774151 RepID=A0A6M5YZD2_9BACT|nr:hypothetical protein FTUN_5870 [Frigoriglobus tundricola]
MPDWNGQLSRPEDAVPDRSEGAAPLARADTPENGITQSAR